MKRNMLAMETDLWLFGLRNISFHTCTVFMRQWFSMLITLHRK